MKILLYLLCREGFNWVFLFENKSIRSKYNTTSNKCIATSNRCLTSSNKKLLELNGLTADRPPHGIRPPHGPEASSSRIIAVVRDPSTGWFWPLGQLRTALAVREQTTQTGTGTGLDVQRTGKWMWMSRSGFVEFGDFSCRGFLSTPIQPEFSVLQCGKNKLLYPVDTVN